MLRTRKRMLTLIAGSVGAGVSVAMVPTLAQPPSQPPAPGQNSGQEKMVDIYETARKEARLKTLVSAIDAAGLSETLKGKGPYTILAPANSAFMSLPPATLEELQKPESKEKLASVLKYHVVLGRYTSADLANMDDKALLPTVNGLPVKLTKLPHVKFNNNVNILTPDIPAENGVIHIIDTVLMPTTAEPVTDPAKPVDAANPTNPSDPAKPDPGTNP